MKSTPGSLFIRADASALAGSGHVMRMLAMAEAAQARGWRVRWGAVEMPGALDRRLQGGGIEVQPIPGPSGSIADASATASAAGAGWVVADGYQFRVEFQRVVKAAGCRLLVMDDNGENQNYECTLVLNQNIGADESLYRQRGCGTRLLLGTRYALLRREFLAARRERVVIPDVARHVLVTMGGADPAGTTGLVMDSLSLLSRPQDAVEVVVGGSNPRRAEVERRAASLRWQSATCLHDVSDMAPLMQRADLAITAGGSTCWELCLLGVPMIAVVIAGNQRHIVRGLASVGAARDAGEASRLDAPTLSRLVADTMDDAAGRGALSRKALGLVDGKGAARVMEAMESLESESPGAAT